MNLKFEHGIIALLLIALLYYIVAHYSLVSDLSRVPDKGNQKLKAIKGKHGFMCEILNLFTGDSGADTC